ncbi:MAG: NYN domain-containing protein [Mycobacterium sp.]
MTSMVEPRIAAGMDSDSLQNGELTSLVRRWMAAGGKAQRVRRDSLLRVAADPVAADPVEAVGGAGEPVVDLLPTVPGAPVSVPGLARRTTSADAEQVNRVALLIDARRIPAHVASALVARLGERGALNVCRAYADWHRVDLGDWAGRMRREGLHSFHHFSDDDDQALVAMALDAVDIARDAAVDEVVIAGDLTSALPLVHRLSAAGVRVVAVGAGHTPHDVRAACHEFIDTASIDGSVVVAQGRHRATT